MELEAILQGLHHVPIHAQVKIATDSSYAITITTSQNPKPKNRDLIADSRDLLACVEAVLSW